MAGKEKIVEHKIKQYLDSLGIICKFEKRHGSAFTKPGLPDISGCYNSFHFEIEVKAPGKLNNRSDAQVVQEKQLRAANGFYLLTDSLTDAIEFIQKIQYISSLFMNKIDNKSSSDSILRNHYFKDVYET